MKEKIYQWHWESASENLLLELREANKKGTDFLNDDSLFEIDLDQLHLASSIWHSIFKQVSRYLPAADS